MAYKMPEKAKPSLDKANAARVRQKEERQRQLLALIATGSKVVDALGAIGASKDSLNYWRKNDPEFAAEYKAVRERAVQESKQIREEHGCIPALGFAAFRKKYFNNETFKWQIKAIEVLETTEELSVAMILLPPGHGKTTLLIDWICYKLAYNPDFRIAVVSKSQNAARKMLAQIKMRMADEGVAQRYPGIAAYQVEYGPFKSSDRSADYPWTADYIRIARNTSDEKDYSVQCLGWTGQVYGGRFDLIVLDDVQTTDTVSQTESMLNKLRLEFFSRFGKDSSPIVYIGTRLDRRDLPGAMIDECDVTPGLLIEFPAVNPATEKGWDPVEGTWEHVDVLCPELYSPEIYGKMRKRSKERIWATAYMQRPDIEGDGTFTEETLDSGLMTSVTKKGLPNGVKIIGLDPALGGGTALVVGSYDREQLVVCDARVYYGLARFEQIFQALDDLCHQHRPAQVVIEINALQRGLARDDRMKALARQHGFVVREHETTGRKADPILGIGLMPGQILRGELKFADGDLPTREALAPLRKELLAWKPDVPAKRLRQDLVMALWFIARHWAVWRAAFANDYSEFQAAGMPYKPTRLDYRSSHLRR